jgi:hypothetical protein
MADKIESCAQDSKNPVVNYVKNLCYITHRWGLWILIAMSVGAWIGITVSKTFYTQKMSDCIKLQGMVFKDQVYTITPK